MNCSTEGCKNETKGRKLCSTCRSRKTRAADPERYAYNNVKNRARKADIPFTISIEYFRQFCYEYDYIDNKGRTSKSMTVDRIEEGRLPGYVEGNIQGLEKGLNVKKYFTYNRELKAGSITKVIEKIDEENPF